MKQALKELIADLIKVKEKHAEVTDTAVREAMSFAVHHSFIVPKSGFVMPDDFEMYSKSGNKQVKKALQKFLKHSEVTFAKHELRTAEQRLNAFQDIKVTVDGRSYREFFGYADKVHDPY